MATATVDHHHHLHYDSLPLIDLRLLAQSELLSLSLCSSRVSTTTSSQNEDEDEVSTPKIDRSVFNESAGSRKQTFSRLRLAPRNSPQIPPQIPYTAARAETLDEDNPQIVGLLESLFNIQSHSSSTIVNDQQLVPVQVEYKAYLNDVNVNVDENLHDVPISVVTYSARKRKRGRPRKDEMTSSDNWWFIESENKVNVVSKSSLNITDNVNVVPCKTGKRKRGRPRKSENRNNNFKVNAVSESAPNVGKRGPGRPRKGEGKNGDKSVKKEIVVSESKEDLVNEALMENRDGIAVNLVALANREDPFGEELRRRTGGSEKREELLGFLTGLKGVWVSYRKKRKIVDASEFGDVLPRGWKLMLCIKKKVGHMWLGCRRYIRFLSIMSFTLLCSIKCIISSICIFYFWLHPLAYMQSNIEEVFCFLKSIPLTLFDGNKSYLKIKMLAYIIWILYGISVCC